MSHEDVLFMSHMIQSVAEACDRIVLTLLACTAVNTITRGLLGLAGRK
jgi:ABC-type Na+ transport system ATPase subunit NatA